MSIPGAVSEVARNRHEVIQSWKQNANGRREGARGSSDASPLVLSEQKPAISPFLISVGQLPTSGWVMRTVNQPARVVHPRGQEGFPIQLMLG